MGVAGEAKGPRADKAVDGQSPWDFAEVVVASRVEVAARAQQSMNPEGMQCAPGLLLVSSN